jgi:hypothetical protein
MDQMMGTPPEIIELMHVVVNDEVRV